METIETRYERTAVTATKLPLIQPSPYLNLNS
jgi:hypothetical protein